MNMFQLFAQFCNYASAIHQSKFKIAKKDGVSFEVAELEAIRNHYSKNQALMTMKQENVIKKISYKKN